MGCCLSRADRAATTAGALQRVTSCTQRAPEEAAAAATTATAPPLPAAEHSPAKAPTIGDPVQPPSRSSQDSTMSRAHSSQSSASEMPPIAEEAEVTEEQMLEAIMRVSGRRFKSGLDKEAYADYLRRGEAGKTPTVGPTPEPQGLRRHPGPHLPTIADGD